jgi:histidine kinase/DNA gyrase B/HSP90-like ATPase
MVEQTTDIQAPSSRRLQMHYAGGLVKHLGLAMYRGAVPSLAELIANAWDADSPKVELMIPFDSGLKDKLIEVRDYGRGMTWEEVQNAYLVVGRDKRKAEGEKTSGGRLLMGRKGLGKLAGFGIAQIVEVRTVRDRQLTHFAMDFAAMTKGGEAEMVEKYEPQVLAVGEVMEENGTTITLRELQLTRPIVKDQFCESMARRFSILKSGFEVLVNGELLSSHPIDLQFEFKGPLEGWEELEGVGLVKWWMGFTSKPIQTEPARGVSIIVRNRMAQTPFFFDLSGGAYGQAGMQYMTGEVHADQLDASDDFIGTDRQGILWAEPMPSALLKWGEARIRELLRKWSELRAQKNEDDLIALVTPDKQAVEARLSRLQPTERAEARRIIRELAAIESVTNEPDRARDLLDMVLRAFEDTAFFALLRALSNADRAEREEVLRLVTEFDVFETIKMAEVVRGRVGVINKFQSMIESDVPEKPDMQDFLFKHPWLIDPEWLVVEHEKGLERLLIDHFKLDPQEDDVDSDRRVDFFCVGTRGRHLVVEVKRPSKPIGKKEVSQITDYVLYLREQAPGRPGAPHFYEGVLVGHHLTPEGIRWRDFAAKDGILVRSWQELLDVAERIHREFLAIMKKRVPDDARVQALPPLAEPNKTSNH